MPDDRGHRSEHDRFTERKRIAQSFGTAFRCQVVGPDFVRRGVDGVGELTGNEGGPIDRLVLEVDLADVDGCVREHAPHRLVGGVIGCAGAKLKTGGEGIGVSINQTETQPIAQAIIHAIALVLELLAIRIETQTTVSVKLQLLHIVANGQLAGGGVGIFTRASSRALSVCALAATRPRASTPASAAIRFMMGFILFLLAMDSG